MKVRASNGSGSTTSPTPRTRARPPTRQKGTSAPSDAASAEVVAPGPAQHGGGVGRAPAEAGAGGDALVQPHVRPCARRRPAPGARGCRRPGGTPAAAGPGRPRARRRRTKRQLVGQVERHHLGVDAVVAVGPHAGDPQRQGELGRRQHAPGSRPSRRRPPACPRPSHVQLLGPGLGPDRRRRRRRSGRPRAGQRAAQHLAALAEARPGPGRTAARGRPRRTAGVGRRSIATSTDSTLGWGRNTVAGTRPTTAAVAQYATFTDRTP